MNYIIIEIIALLLGSVIMYYYDSIKQLIKTTKNWIPFILLFDGFFLGDCGTTWAGIYLKCIPEQNPVLTWLFGVIGIVAGLVLFKIVIVSIVLSAGRYLKKYSSLWTPEIFAVILGLEGYIISIINALVVFGVIKNGIF